MTNISTPFALTFAALLAACGGDDDNPPAPVTMACADFSGKTIAGAAVTGASVVAATAAAPEYCRVQATIPSKLRFELRLPTTGWNGKLLYGGGGGFNGSIPPANAAALSAGYANVTSDSGHVGSSDVDATWALNDAEALNNYANLSVPRVTLAAREMVRQRYGSEAQRAYFEGCSNGGREALMAAQRNPELFDGIIARAPAYNITSLLLHFQRSAKLLAAPGGAFTAGKVATLATAVLTACDALDGSTDGVVSNPAACTFDPAVLACSGPDSDACLTAPQLAVVNSWTSDYTLPGTSVAAIGYPLTGNETDPATWSPWFLGGGGIPSYQYLFMIGGVNYMFTKNPLQDPLTYDPAADLGVVAALTSLANADDPDLTRFKARGGKLILWHGATDPAISVKGTTSYYTKAVTAIGGQAAADEFMRYYQAPGVAHCVGGPGADTADLLTPLDAWVSSATAPGTLTAKKVNPTNGATVFSRPLCVHPKYPHYNGSGDVSAAANYTCT